MPDRWLVTGSAGFLGMNAGLWLRDRAYAIGQVRVPSPIGPFREQIPVDLRDLDALEAHIRRTRPDVLLNAAAISGHETCAHDPEQAWAVNVESVRLISSLSSELGIRLIHISTDAVFSGSSGGYRESDETNPFSLYGETKLEGERVVAASGAQALVVRTNFFGWSSSGRRSVLEFFVNALRSDTPVGGYPDFIVTTIYVQELMRALWQLDQQRATGLVHIASSDALSKFDFGKRIARQFALNSELIAAVPSSESGHATSRSRDLSLNTDLLTSLLGSPAPTQAEGIRSAYLDEATVARTLRRFDSA